MTPLDRTRLTEALGLAQNSIGLSEPNPRVGCIIGLADGTVLGSGWTQERGGPHAEVVAMQDATRQGRSMAGATAWVTLEPCAHFGRTPPCCDALIAAQVARVVVAVDDPFAAVSGRGITRLRAAGIEVVMADAEIARAAVEMNIGFFSRVRRNRPWVRMKLAASLDGRTALDNGVSQWITGPEAREDGHAWRRRSGAVLTGIGTVIADDPGMDVRLVATARQPRRVVMDSSFRTPLDARILAATGGVLVVGATAHPKRQAALEARGAQCLVLPGSANRVDLQALLARLAADEVNELHVEAGAVLSGALLNAGLVDELLVYQAPLMLGQGRPMAAFGPLTSLTEGFAFGFIDVATRGRDLRVRARVVSAFDALLPQSVELLDIQPAIDCEQPSKSLILNHK